MVTPVAGTSAASNQLAATTWCKKCGHCSAESGFERSLCSACGVASANWTSLHANAAIFVMPDIPRKTSLRADAPAFIPGVSSPQESAVTQLPAQLPTTVALAYAPAAQQFFRHLPAAVALAHQDGKFEAAKEPQYRKAAKGVLKAPGSPASSALSEVTQASDTANLSWVASESSMGTIDDLDLLPTASLSMQKENWAAWQYNGRLDDREEWQLVIARQGEENSVPPIAAPVVGLRAFVKNTFLDVEELGTNSRLQRRRAHSLDLHACERQRPM